MKQVNAGLLNVGYAEDGPAGGLPVMLLHGWPYDIYSFVDVAPLLASAGYRVIGLSRHVPADAPFEIRACDVSDAASVREAFADLRRSSDVYALINAAGIAITALGVMLDRIAHPQMPPRDVLLDCKLVIRRSCGSHLRYEKSNHDHSYAH